MRHQLKGKQEGGLLEGRHPKINSVYELGVVWVRQNMGVQSWDLRGVGCAHERLSLGVSIALRSLDEGIPSQSSGYDSALSLPWAPVQSLVKERRSH